MHEADLANHLINDKDPNAEKKPLPMADIKADEKKDEKDEKPPARIEPTSKDDFQFQQAINLLKGQPVKGERPKADAAPKTAEAAK